MEWETPVIVELNGTPIHGDCSVGTGAEGYCNSGPSSGSSCGSGADGPVA